MELIDSAFSFIMAFAVILYYIADTNSFNTWFFKNHIFNIFSFILCTISRPGLVNREASHLAASKLAHQKDWQLFSMLLTVSPQFDLGWGATLRNWCGQFPKQWQVRRLDQTIHPSCKDVYRATNQN